MIYPVRARPRGPGRHGKHHDRRLCRSDDYEVLATDAVSPYSVASEVQHSRSVPPQRGVGVNLSVPRRCRRSTTEVERTTALEYDDAMRVAGRAPTTATTWMASTILGTTLLGGALSHLQCGAGSARVGTFPLKDDARADALPGIVENATRSSASDGRTRTMTGSQGLEGSLQRGDHPSESVGRGPEDAEPEGGFWEMVRPARADTLEPS